LCTSYVYHPFGRFRTSENRFLRKVAEGEQLETRADST
jgi:hypothetical protein